MSWLSRVQPHRGMATSFPRLMSVDYRCEPVPLTRQPIQLTSDSLGGHCSRSRGGVPSGAGATNRAEISPPPVMRTVLVTGSYRQPCEQGLKPCPVSQVTPMNHPGHPMDKQRSRAPVVRPSMFPDRDHTTRPSSTRPSGPQGISFGHEPGLSLCSFADCDMTSGYCLTLGQGLDRW